jgi:hypothetical protein
MENGLPDDSLKVRIFTIADFAAGPPDNKLYITGAGITQVFMQQLPGPLPGLYLAVRIRIPWRMLSEQHTLAIRLLTEDRQLLPEVPDPIFSVPFELGRAPGTRVGDESALNLAMGVMGIPIPREGTFNFHLQVDEQVLDVLPLKVRLLPQLNAIRLT